MSLLTDLLFKEGEELSEEELNRRVHVIVDTLEKLLAFTPDWQEQVDALRLVALQRINDALLPAFQQITDVADLGALFSAPSSSAVEIGLGVKTFVIPPAQRPNFAPAATLMAYANGSYTNALVGYTSSYDREAGTLVISVVQARGAGSHSAWTITPIATTDDLEALRDQVQALATAASGSAASSAASATSSAGSATAAAGSASAASGHATAAQSERTAAQTARTGAETAQTGAQTAKGSSETARDAAIAAKTAAENLLAKSLRVDAPQAFTPVEQGRGLANLGAGSLAGNRSAVINGNFDVWQRGTSFAASATRRYTADRFESLMLTTTVATTREDFAVGQTDVPGSPRYFFRNVVAAGAGVGDYARIDYRVEGVRRYAGRKSTLTFYAKASANRNLSIEFYQGMGAGGSPSANVDSIGVQKLALTTAWQKFSITVDMPSIIGKTLGTDLNDYMAAIMWLDAGSNFNGRTGSIGHQSGTFDIAHLSWVAGDATTEDDPFPLQPLRDVLRDCLRYCRVFGGVSNTEPLTVAQAISATAFFGYLKLNVPMRAVPSMSISAAGDWRISLANATSTPAVTFTLGVGSSTDTINFSGTVASGLVAGNATAVSANTTSNARLILDAEI